jgi:hypothetical protein
MAQDESRRARLGIAIVGNVPMKHSFDAKVMGMLEERL